MNPKTYDFRELVEQSGLGERTVRNYLYRLIPEEERIKGSHRYPKSVRDKLVFVRMLREEMNQHGKRLSIEGIRQILEDVADSIEAVADGREPLDILDVGSSNPARTRKKINEVKARGETVLPIGMSNVDDDDEPIVSLDSSNSTHKSANDELWHSLRLGTNVELRVRGNYPKKTLDQLTMLGQFVESILQEE